jgi:hypothetical protein
MGVTAFVVEDKSSGLDFDTGMLDHMRRYAEGSTAYALRCNARELRLERFSPSGTNETMAVCSVDGLFGPTPIIDPRAEEVALLQTSIPRVETGPTDGVARMLPPSLCSLNHSPAATTSGGGGQSILR